MRCMLASSHVAFSPLDFCFCSQTLIVFGIYVVVTKEDGDNLVAVASDDHMGGDFEDGGVNSVMFGRVYGKK